MGKIFHQRTVYFMMTAVIVFSFLFLENGYLSKTVMADSAGLEKGETYLVPASLKKSTDNTVDSAASSALAKYVEVFVNEQGEYQITAELSGVTIAGITDWCENIRYYNGNYPFDDETKWEEAEVLEEKEVSGSLDGNNKMVPVRISFTMPQEMKEILEKNEYKSSGVYIKMFVEMMQNSPSAYMALDFANAKKMGDASYMVNGSSKVNLFGKYNVNASVSVTNGKISDVEVAGSDFGGTYADFNKMKLETAAAGLKKQLIGKYDIDQEGIHNVDAVSGATVSSGAIRDAVLKALNLTLSEEDIPEAPETVSPGRYSISIANKTDVVKHSLVEDDKADAVLTVEEDGHMYLQYRMISSTVKEPLQVLGFNGYYAQNDKSEKKNLTTEGIVYQYESETTYGWDVVTDIRIPLTGKLSNQYYTNVYLYVDAMKNLGAEKPEEISGVWFDKGYFNIDSTILLYWDTLEELKGDIVDKSKLENLYEQAVAVIEDTTGSYDDEDKAAAEKARNEAAKGILSSEATKEQIDQTIALVTQMLETLLSVNGEETGRPTGGQTLPETTNSNVDQATAALPAGTICVVEKHTYQVTAAGTATLLEAANQKNVKIPATITVGGIKRKVTAIGNSAFQKAKKKLKTVTLGANITFVGKKAFAGCKKLKKITIRSKKLEKVGKKALKGIKKNAVINVPKKYKKAYKKLFKNKGQTKSVVIR